MSDELKDELESETEPTEEVENTEEVEDTDVESEQSEDEPKYTESEMKSFARAKKAEAEAKRLKKEKADLEAKLKEKEKSTNNPTPKPQADDVDEKILRATKGYDDDAIDELKYIAGRKGISLFAAEQDKRFVNYQKQAEEEQRQAEATLGASKGSGRKKSEPSFRDPLSSEEHRKLWEKLQK